MLPRPDAEHARQWERSRCVCRSGGRHERGGAVRKEGTSAALAKAAQRAKAQYVLTLFVAGVTPRSAAAIRSVTQICESHLKDRYDLEIIDIYQQPTLTRGQQIVAAPTLLKTRPLPLRKLIGDMTNIERLLVGLDLRVAG